MLHRNSDGDYVAKKSMHSRCLITARITLNERNVSENHHAIYRAMQVAIKSQRGSIGRSMMRFKSSALNPDNKLKTHPMPKDTYQSLQAQIKRLQDKAESIRAKERQPVIASILRSMDEYAITLDELKAALTRTPSRKRARMAGARPAAKTAKPVAPKYRHPDSGETWTGRGKAPRWLVAAEADGASRDQFLIQP